MANSNKIFSLMQTSFDNFDQTIRNYLSKTFNNLGMQYTHSQIFGVIFDGIKGVMQNAMFYIEDALTEQNVLMASRKKSIYSLAKISGYEPHYGSAATGTLCAKVKISNGLSSKATKIYIDNYATVVNKITGITYTLVLSTNKHMFDISAPLVNHDLKIVQGTYQYAQYVGTGEPLEKISVNVTGLFDRDYFNVYVNGEKWDIVSSLYDMTKDSKTCIITSGYENTFDITFGTGVYGKIPESGATIVIYYLTHSGSSGNIGVNTDALFKFSTSGYDSLGNTVNLNDYVTLVIDSAISGGTDSDSISFVREMIGCNSRSNVLASEDNFRLFFKRFSFIGNVNCWSDTDSMIINAVCTSNILSNITEYEDYYSINPNELILTDNQKSMIVTTLNNSNKAYAGMSLRFQDPYIRRYALQCYIKIADKYNKDVIKQSLRDAFANYFMSLPDNTQFIPKSDIVALALETSDEIESFDVNIISELAEDTFKDGYYYKYELKLVNGAYQYVPKQVFYEKDSTPGLDDFGNIQLNSRLEIPLLGGGFKYYPYKDDNNKTSSIQMEAVQFYFIS